MSSFESASMTIRRPGDIVPMIYRTLMPIADSSASMAVEESDYDLTHY
ncbi:MAG: hypothetical protein JWQ98_1513 [Chlorobi bacterium]|nr:hypothetical protein [Chlorobiota bacterium]